MTDGCDLGEFEPLADDDIDAFVMFADVEGDEAAIAVRVADLKAFHE